MDNAIPKLGLAMNQLAIIFEGRMPIPGMMENSLTQKF